MSPETAVNNNRCLLLPGRTLSSTGTLVHSAGLGAVSCQGAHQAQTCQSLYGATAAMQNAEKRGDDGRQITDIAWNNKVYHICAVGCQNGQTMVWDLKKSKPIIRLNDTSG